MDISTGSQSKQLDKRLSHDDFFKLSMKNLKIARDFFASHLPKRLLQYTDLSVLHSCPTSFLTNNYQSRHADMLYRTKIYNKCAYFYVLVEQQSKNDPLMALRIIEYVLAIIRWHVREHKSKVLPIVAPLVYYTGRSKFTGPVDIFDLFSDKQQDLARDLMFKPFTLIDISQMSDAKLQADKRAAVMNLAMRHVHLNRSREFLQLLEIQAAKYFNTTLDTEYLDAVLHYYLSRADKQIVESIFTQVEQHESMIGEKAMTAAEELIRRGIIEGEKRGIIEGEKRGIIEGERRGEKRGEMQTKRQMVKSFLAAGVDMVVIAEASGFTLDEIKSIDLEKVV